MCPRSPWPHADRTGLLHVRFGGRGLVSLSFRKEARFRGPDLSVFLSKRSTFSRAGLVSLSFEKKHVFAAGLVRISFEKKHVFAGRTCQFFFRKEARFRGTDLSVFLSKRSTFSRAGLVSLSFEKKVSHTVSCVSHTVSCEGISYRVL